MDRPVRDEHGRTFGSDGTSASFVSAVELTALPRLPEVAEELERAIISLRGAQRAALWGDLEMADSLVCEARGACDDWLMSRSIPSADVPTAALHSFLSWEAEQ
jgi:hypothetical protein